MEYIVTAKVQLVLSDDSSFGARMQMLELLDVLIHETNFRNDPNNGRVIESVVDLSVEEPNAWGV
jgi:hypothetical protein